MRALILLLLTATLAACGFQLRGSQALPFSTLHIALSEMAELHGMIKRNVEAGSPTRVVSTVQDAEASLSILFDQPQKKVLSYDASGRVREFQLERTFTFRVTDTKGAILIAPSTLIIRRDFTFNDAQILSKEAEEALLWRDIQTDLVQQLIRRLAAAKPVAATRMPAAPEKAH